MVSVKCLYCGNVLKRRPYLIKIRKRFYCNASHQIKYEYKVGIRDKNKITKKANATLKQRTIDRLNAGNPNTKVGKRGYRLVYLPEIGWYPEHKFIWEKFNGKIPKGAHLHHINGDKIDNRIENLRLFASNSEHIKFHNEKKKRNHLGKFV